MGGMRRAHRAATFLPVLIGAMAAAGLTAAAGSPAIDAASSVGASFKVDRALDAPARAAFVPEAVDPVSTDTSASFNCEVMNMTADPEAED
jgi:hypothetical protein